MALTHVLTPITIGSATIRNRVVRTAHGTRLALHSFDDMIEYHVQRAKGGVGLTVIEIMGVHPSSTNGMSYFLPSVQANYPRMMERLRPLGMTVFQQLWHAGNNIPPADGSPPWSASDIPGVRIQQVPIPMTKGMIDEVIEGYVKAARQAYEWGAQGVEFHAAHSYLPAQFLSPNTNKRTDEYGGSFENRARFSLEILQALRDGLPKECVVGARVAPDDTPGGVGVADVQRLVEMFESRGLIDYVSVSMGGYQAEHRMIGPMFEPSGYELPTSVPITQKTKLPTMVIGRFRTLEEADAVIRAGDADMVGMVRANIADPYLVKKTMDGHPERVRPCIGCNQGCVAGIMGPASRMGCTVNPAVGFETKMGDHLLTPVESPKKVLVIGGGPSGMEAARVAATRGHKVVLVEAQSDLGGTINIAAKAPARAGIRDITVWMEQEIYRLGVEVRLNTYLETADVLAEKPDAVIVATGSTPRMDGLQTMNAGEPVSGLDQAHVVSAQDVLTDPSRDLGTHAVVFDDVGHYEGIAITEYLLAKGLHVTFVGRQPGFGIAFDMAFTTDPTMARMISDRFSEFYRYRALSIGKSEVTIAPTYVPADTNHRKVIRADTVVMVGFNRQNRDIYEELHAQGVNVRVVGDANSPRYLPTAIKEGNIAGASV